MTSLAFVLQPVNLLILGGFLFLIFVLLTLLYVYLNIHRIRRKKELNAAIEEKRLAYEKAPPSTVDPKANRFAFPLVKVSGPPISEVISETNSKSPIPSNYKTFDFARRAHRHLSSDSSYTSSNPRHSASTSFPFDTVKSKFQQIQRRSTPSPTSSRQLETISSDQRSLQMTSDSDEEFLPAPPTPTFEYSLAGYFRIEWIYKVFYSIDHRQLLFQLVQFKSMQPMIERCFPSLICKVRLFTHNGKRKGKKYFSKKDSVNEIFKFDMDQYTLDESYLKIQFYGQKKNEKRLELAQTVLVLNQFENLTLRTPHHHDDGLKNSQEHVKSLPIIEDRIEMITRAQNPAENEARALISLVYENDRCLLHVGVIKIAAIQSLVKPLIEHSNHRSDAIQIKICTTMDGKTLSKEKSKFLAVEKDSFSFSTSFHLDYLSLHKISVCISIFYRKSLIGSQGKLLSSLEFGSTQLKSQQSFQHWTDTLSGPTKPHIHWHTLQPNPMIKDK